MYNLLFIKCIELYNILFIVKKYFYVSKLIENKFHIEFLNIFILVQIKKLRILLLYVNQYPT